MVSVLPKYGYNTKLLFIKKNQSTCTHSQQTNFQTFMVSEYQGIVKLIKLQGIVLHFYSILRFTLWTVGAENM